MQPLKLKMSNNKQRPPGFKILIQKQHPILHSCSLNFCFKSALLLIQRAPGTEDTDAEITKVPCRFHSSAPFSEFPAESTAFHFLVPFFYT